MKKIETIKKFIAGFLSKANLKRRTFTKKTLLFVNRKPFTAFFLVLAIFLLLMIFGNLFFGPKPQVSQKTPAPKEVHVYNLGTAPVNTYQGKVEKGGVVKIVAQNSGIVSAINVYEGQAITRGTNILSLSTNYSGGNTFSIFRQIAQTQYQTTQDTFNTQKEIILNQRKLTDNNRSNGDLMRQVISQSATDTQAVLDLQTQIVNGISANIQNLESTNVGGINDTAILQSKELLAQYQGAMAQTRASFGNLQIQANSTSAENVPSQFEIAQKQLDLQEKNLQMSLEIARLQYNMALVNEANMFPSSPFTGVIDKIFVHVGENVNSGTVLAQVTSDSQTAEISVNVPSQIAKNISRFEPSILHLDTAINMLPTFVSQNATDGTLYSVIYDLEPGLAPDLTDNSYISVDIPIGTADTTNIDPFVPLDSVSQTQDNAYVYVVENGVAKVRNVTLGQIQGRFVEILKGLSQNAEIILERNVIDGDKVKVVN